MPYRIYKTIEIENGHLLTHHPDKFRFPHGHSRKVEIVNEADEIARGLADYAQRGGTRYKLRPSVRLVKVRVLETSSSWAEYEA